MYQKVPRPESAFFISFFRFWRKRSHFLLQIGGPKLPQEVVCSVPFYKRLLRDIMSPAEFAVQVNTINVIASDIFLLKSTIVHKKLIMHMI